LFEQYLSETIVFMNDDFDGQVVFNRRDQFTDELSESAISPTMATDWRFGKANCAAIAKGRPGAMVASMPVPVNFCCSFSSMVRAAKWVLAPQSREITASGASSSAPA